MFRKLKERFTKEPVLAILNLDKNKDGSGYIRLYDKKSLIYRI